MGILTKSESEFDFAPPQIIWGQNQHYIPQRPFFFWSPPEFRQKKCPNFQFRLLFGSGYFASRGKIAPCYFAIWKQNCLNGYFAASAKIALSLILTQIFTLTQTLTLIPTLTLTLTQTVTQIEEKHYFASGGKIATSFLFLLFWS